MGSLNLRGFDGHLHHTLRIAAAKRSVSIKELVERITREWLEREKELPKSPRKKAKGRPARTGRPL